MPQTALKEEVSRCTMV